MDPREGIWLGRLEEIIRLTAPPAGAAEIAEQGLGHIAAAIDARRGVLVTRAAPGAASVVVAAIGGGPAEDLVTAALATPAEGSPLVLPLRLEAGAAGALVLDLSSRPDPVALSFARAAAEALAAALRGARSGEARRSQGELLARRNLELDTLRAIGADIQEEASEERVLQAVIDRLVERLDLEAGWIFWGEERHGRLALAASRGLPADFVSGARSAGINPCLCLDVFKSGRLRVARNTEECPRLPDLLGASGPRSHACIPLKFERGVLGVLNVANRPGVAFSQEELEFLETVGTQACLAVDKRRTGRAEAAAYHEAREALVRLQEAQEGMVRAERLAAVGTLASSLAHEVRNPLNSISLTLVLLTRRLARVEGADPSLAPMVEDVRREVERLDALVGEFLSLATLDRLQREESDARAIVREALALVSPLAAAQGIEVRQESHGDPPRLPLDRRKMTQVLLNLLRNAIDAMPHGGVLTAVARAGEDEVAIEVTDTGVGIEPGLDVFNFFTSTKRGGTGLGLPISRGIVEAHGGRLAFESVPGRGTTFRILLPVPPSRRARGTEGS
jgi:signal transduction histidine kinase